MTEFATSLGNGLALIICACFLLLLLGANFVPAWAKSRAFLIIAGAAIIAGSNPFT